MPSKRTCKLHKIVYASTKRALIDSKLIILNVITILNQVILVPKSIHQLQYYFPTINWKLSHKNELKNIKSLAQRAETCASRWTSCRKEGNNKPQSHLTAKSKVVALI